jgi:hypothetical protein
MMVHVYTDLDFFILIKKLRNELLDEYDSGKLEILQKLLNMLLQGDKRLVLKQTGANSPWHPELMRVLMDQHSKGKIELKILGHDDFINEVKAIDPLNTPFAIFLTSFIDDELISTIQDHGYYYLNPVNLNGLLPILDQLDKRYIIHKEGDIKNWHELSQLAHNCHSILIFDSYLFATNKKTGRSGYLETISEFVNKINSCNSAKKIHVLIAISRNEAIKNLDKIKDEIENSLNHSCSGKIIKVSVVKLTQKMATHHDRHIYTNFCIITSGDSFNYFEKENNNTIDTTISVTSILNLYEFNKLLNKLKRLEKSIPLKDQIGTVVYRSQDTALPLLSNI